MSPVLYSDLFDWRCFLSSLLQLILKNFIFACQGKCRFVFRQKCFVSNIVLITVMIFFTHDVPQRRIFSVQLDTFDDKLCFLKFTIICFRYFCKCVCTPRQDETYLKVCAMFTLHNAMEKYLVINLNSLNLLFNHCVHLGDCLISYL